MLHDVLNFNFGRSPCCCAGFGAGVFAFAGAGLFRAFHVFGAVIGFCTMIGAPFATAGAWGFEAGAPRMIVGLSFSFCGCG